MPSPTKDAKDPTQIKKLQAMIEEAKARLQQNPKDPGLFLLSCNPAQSKSTGPINYAEGLFADMTKPGSPRFFSAKIDLNLTSSDSDTTMSSPASPGRQSR